MFAAIGLQTHFGEESGIGAIGRDKCYELAALGITHCRIDAQTCPVGTMHEMVSEVVGAGMVPLVIVASLEMAQAVPDGVAMEWRNEPDGHDYAHGDIRAEDYRRELDAFCEVAASKGCQSYGLSLSNLSHDAITWGNRVRDIGGGWPATLTGISVHSYRRGSRVDEPNAHFESRENEVDRWVRALAQDKAVICTEFGHSLADEAHAAANIAWEWNFWNSRGIVPYLYQIRDGDSPGDHWGLYRADGSLKDAIASTIPKPPAPPEPVPEPEPEPDVYPFPAESGPLHIDGMVFRRADGSAFQWRGFSWFLGFLRYCRGEDITPDLRWMRAMGFNIPRIFGPLPWDATPDYRVEHFDFDKLDSFLTLLEAHGLRSNWSLGHYRHPGLKSFVERFYEVASRHWSVVVEAVNEPGVHGGSPSAENPLDRRKPDPIELLNGIDRRGVLTAYGLNAGFYDGQPGRDPVLDFATLHVQRDTAWHRKARHAQEWQADCGKPVVSDEPAKITEPGFHYPGGKNDPANTPAEMVWHSAVTCLWTPGCTVHTEFGKWGNVPPAGSLQHAVCEAVRDHVWMKIDASWQTGEYNHSGNHDSPVDDVNEPDGDPIWSYTSLHANKALSVRCAFSAPRPINGWRVVDAWGPSHSLVRLER